MKGARACLLTLLLSGCSQPHRVEQSETPGARLEAAATRAGLIADPAAGSLAGAWMLDTDRACIVPVGRGVSRIGVLVDYGEGQGCVASGTLARKGGALDIRLGDSCRIDAAFDGTRIIFPPAVPEGCRTLCRGRASLESFTVEQVSQSVSEAGTLRAADGAPLCATPGG